MIYEATVEQDPETGEFMLTLPPEIVQALDIQDGDRLIWELDGDTVSLRKARPGEMPDACPPPDASRGP